MSRTDAKPRVLILYGGQSPEHSVSCVTAAGVLTALDGGQFEPIPVGITQSGQWTVPAVDPRTHQFTSGGALPAVRPRGSTVQLFWGHNSHAELLEIWPDGTADFLGRVDAVFPLVHGPFGEDGTLQGLFELAGLPYVGAGVLASAMGMDKQFMKIAFEAAGLKVGPYLVFAAGEWESDVERSVRQVHDLELPVFVKPARGGSSVGITRVDSWENLLEAVATAQNHDPKIVIEQGITGREIECGVLGSGGGEPARASECGEIVIRDGSETHQFYDFTTKYTDQTAADLACPADLPQAVSDEVRRQAVLAFEALGSEGIARVDFFYTTEGDVVINEVNTMPGFTPTSMYPQMWSMSGISYRGLLAELLTLALKRPTGLR